MRRDSITLNWRIDPWVVIAVAALIAVLFYLISSALIFRIGFPLDDAWIHQTYARNLAQHREWAFRLGERSAGSTAPLWTALLAIGFLIGLAPYVWTYLLGWVILTLLAIYAENVAQKLVPAYKSRIPWAGLFFVFAWHLTWAAVSGMETLLHALIIFVVLSALISHSRRYLTLGLLAGLSIWVRPDGLTLLGPILFVALLSENSWYLRGEALWKTLLGFGALFFPYLLFNLALSGNPMPNTFYAKQAEYDVYWMSKTIMERVSDYLWPILASPFVVLIPGALMWLFRSIRARNWGTLASVVWVFGYIAIYFTRLPAYQHGRYVIPALPIMYLWGILGLLEYVSSAKANRHVVKVWNIAIIALCLMFELLGARQNAYDVFWIESQMVRTAQWVEKNLPPNARLAVHDIGALGFYVQNPLVDMAGLITPEVVPFIRDQPRLAEYLDSNSVDYLISFPSLYPQLTAHRESLFEAGVALEPMHFDENMHVYRWK
ncbi:MAG TPA: hypothetical protein VK249_10175 [Anaerolineales bacterium]|nr:hypothetical protein [Anaerolineales bacterium]